FSTILPAQQEIIRARIEENREHYPEYFSSNLVSQPADVTAEEIRQRVVAISTTPSSDSVQSSRSDKLAQRLKTTPDFFFDLDKEKGYGQTLQLTPIKGENGFYISMNQYYRIRY